MKIKDIMSKNVKTLSLMDPVSKFISLMEREHIHEVIVMDGKKLKGIAKFKSIITRGVTDPSKQKMKNILDSKPPKLELEQEVGEAAELLSKTGLRALPVVDKGEIKGIVSISDVLNAISLEKEFMKTKAEEIISSIVVVAQDVDIGKARVLMREKGISRIPVVGDDKKIVGIIAVHDLMKAVKNPRERMGMYSMAAEMERITAMPVSNIMNTHPPTAEAGDTLNNVIRKMQKFGCTGITVVEKGVPIGVITPKDLLEVYVGGFQQKGVFYQTIGLEGEDEFSVSTIDRMIRDSVQKINSIYKIQYMFAHFKKYKPKGLRAKWSIRIRIMTDKGMYMSKAVAWDLIDVASEALGKIERILIKRKKEAKTRMEKNDRRRKGGRR
ncbi:MAG: CBS domain-containing protein [Candidatus Aenigmarchaeota archaeon]|nr:CBS domain-containing protein [Candidatus Aenigmarchaeota archaeon]